jgi:hypothetical protein
MSANPEVEEIVPLPALVTPVETNGHLVERALEAPPGPVQEQIAQPASTAKAGRARPPWLATASVGVVALMAASTLGYVAYATSRERDGLRTQLASTMSTLGSTRNDLSAAQAQAQSKKLTADYVALYIVDLGRVQTDYQVLSACNSFGSCRTSSQQLLTDLQAFQSDRKLANVPADMAESDASLGDALSAAIAADQEIISGMDSGSVGRFTDGFKKLNAAMLNVAKAESALGAELK